MDRRGFLALGAGVALAGCSTGSPGGGRPSTTATTRRTQSTPTPIRARVGDVQLPVARKELRTALARDAIPAVTEPAFADGWTGFDGPTGPLPELPDDDPVVGVARGGEARAYPLRVLNRHEVVNDQFDGPLLVTFCVLCGSAVVAERRVNGDAATFGVSGLLWRSDLVLYDTVTESLWSQLLAAAIRGPRTGERLSLLPASLTSLGEWRQAHPSTRVLLPPPASGLIAEGHFQLQYDRRRYDYHDDSVIGWEPADDGLHPKTLVAGVAHDGTAVAYPYPAVASAGAVNDVVAGLPVVVTITPAGGLRSFDRRVDGRTLRFEPADETTLAAGSSRWDRFTGRAVDGPLTGHRLRATSEIPAMFWTGWRAFHPDTMIWTPDGRRTTTPTRTPNDAPY